MTTPKIRLAVPGDAEEMLNIYTPYIRETVITFEYRVPALEEFRRRVEETLVNYPWLVLEQDGHMLGYAYASRFQSRAAYQWGADGSIYLRQGAGGRGLGAPLYRCLMELIKKQGVRSFYGCITHPNPASEAFHRKLGFTQVGMFPKAGYKLGRWLDVLWVELALGDRTAPPDALIPFSAMEPEAVERILEQANRALESGSI